MAAKAFCLITIANAHDRKFDPLGGLSQGFANKRVSILVLRVLKPHAYTTAIGWDELNASVLEGLSDCLQIRRSEWWAPVVNFRPTNCGDTNAGSHCQLFSAPTQ